MTVRARAMRLLQQEDLNFLLTNRLPRRLTTTMMGRVSRLRHPLIARPSIALWRFFSGADLSDAAEARFPSLHDAFVRRLRPGARRFADDAATIASPCDAIVGAHGPIRGDEVLQIKGFPYRLGDLIPNPGLVDRLRDGSYVTLRLTAGMYHRFHAPHDLTVTGVTYLSGDCWNVNPIALRRVERLFCRNERAVIEVRLACGTELVLVAVAAILVASIRLRFLDTGIVLRDGHAGRRIACDAAMARGAEMGWFEHGSTILAFAPPAVALAPGFADGQEIRAGQPLLRLLASRSTDSPPEHQTRSC